MQTTFNFLGEINFFDIQEEVWIDIPNFEGLYKFSNKYRVVSVDRIVKGRYNSNRKIKGKEVIIKGDKKHYPSFHLWKNNKGYAFEIHTFIAKLFIENKLNKTQVNHKNGNKFDYSINNLEWCTPSENMKHAYDTGLRTCRDLNGENNPRAKLNIQQVDEIRSLFITGEYTKKRLSDIYKIDPSVITDIISFEIWNKTKSSFNKDEYAKLVSKVKLNKKRGFATNAKLVLDLRTGIFYDCALDAFDATNIRGINLEKAKLQIRNKIVNKLDLIYA